MQHQIKKARWVAIGAVALLAVPVAQAKPVSFPQRATQQQGETAQGLAADGMRLTAQAQVYADSQEIRSEGVARHRAAEALSQSLGTATQAKAYQQQLSPTPSAATTGIQKHYPFANENTAAFQVAESAGSGPAPVSENSPIENRIENPSSPATVPSSARGFDWGDAGIGAGLAALLTSMLALGAGSAVSRKRVAHV